MLNGGVHASVLHTDISCVIHVTGLTETRSVHEILFGRSEEVKPLRGLSIEESIMCLALDRETSCCERCSILIIGFTPLKP
jgi:hypothetical protein